MSDLKQRINEDVKNTMRSQDKARLGVLRMILAALKQKEVDERITLDDDQVVLILDKMSKQLRDSISQFKQAGRNDLVEKESFELEIVQSYLPTQLNEAEILDMIKKAIQASGATTMKDMGKVMGLLKPELQGRADMAAVSQLVKQQLG